LRSCIIRKKNKFNLTSGIGDIVLHSNKHDGILGWDLKFKKKQGKISDFSNKLDINTQNQKIMPSTKVLKYTI